MLFSVVKMCQFCNSKTACSATQKEEILEQRKERQPFYGFASRWKVGNGVIFNERKKRELIILDP
jgi:hypothetical protein